MTGGVLPHRKRPMFDRRKTTHKTVFYLTMVLAGNSILTASLIINSPAKLVWNVSESLPRGLYRITNSLPAKGNLVLVRLPNWARFLANQRKYLPRSTPALKRIYGVRGDVVCRFGRVILINHEIVAIAKNRDHSGRKMPLWRGCKVLNEDELFLLTRHPGSFAGRYFGVVKSCSVIGTVMPAWLVSD